MLSVDDLLKERNEEYEQAWLDSTLIFDVGRIRSLFVKMVAKDSRFVWNWFVIWNKMVRILANPAHLDSWRDIAGYATLVVKHLEGTDNDKTDSS